MLFVFTSIVDQYSYFNVFDDIVKTSLCNDFLIGFIIGAQMIKYFQKE